MPMDDPHRPPLLTMTQEDFDRAVAAAVLALSRNQHEAPAGHPESPPDLPKSLRSRLADCLRPLRPREPHPCDPRKKLTTMTPPWNQPLSRSSLGTQFEYTDAIKCRVFLTTLAGSALRWFNRLPPSSIGSFADFKDSFLRHFATSRTYRKTSMDLFSIKQKARESLKEYVHRFNQVVQEVPAATSDVLVSAFSQGLVEGDFFRSLIKKPPENFDILLSRAVKYIHVEEAQSARRKEADSNQHGGPSRNPPTTTRAEQRPLPQPLRRPDSDTPAAPAKSNHRSIHAVANQSDQSTGGCRWLPRFCAYHQSRSHATSECHQYARELRRDAEQRAQGSPAPRPRRSPTKRTTREARPPSPRPARTQDRSPRQSAPPTRQEVPRPQVKTHEDAPEDNRNNAPRGSIHMITGGATDGDSHRARKAHSRQLEVYGVEQRQTSRSSVNIIFKKAFDQMQIDEADLQPMATSLFGFTGNEVQPLGQITLAISLGEEPLRRTRRVPFTIVDAPSAYNVILGRPTLSAFSAVVSTYHQKMKFPVGDKLVKPEEIN
ncbi:uncharacterized protein LOC141847612 [Curcuma longa]|uniref:uncharacterized protein LOC141847612 n=1 Tax=Curcuma longa TaxID=136217 RepID=UPI003D9E95BF